MKKQRLLLWDIDGTLISTGAAGILPSRWRRHGDSAASGDLEGVEIAGRTDSSIAHQILAKYGEPITEESMRSFLDLYLEVLARELPRSQWTGACLEFWSCSSELNTDRIPSSDFSPAISGAEPN